MKILDNSNNHIVPMLHKLVEEKIQKQIVNVKFIGGGSYGRVFKAILHDDTVIALKAYRMQGSQYAEAEQLQILSRNTFVKMPDVLFTYEDENTAILAMTFVEGRNVLNPLFLLKNKQAKLAFAQDVINGMLQWHEVTNDKFGALSNPVYDTWIDFYQTEKQVPWLQGLSELTDNGKFSKKNLQLLLEATEVFNSLPAQETKPVLIHSDLNIMNIMAEPKTCKLTAFIDPCSCMWADREYDLFQLRNMWGDAFGLYETYKQKYNLSEYADFRVAYYGAMNEAACRLGGGLIMPLWEILCNNRLKKEMKKIQ